MKKLNLLFGTLFFVFAVACQNNSTGTNDTQAADEQAINDVLNVDELVYDEIGDPSEDAINTDSPSWLGTSESFAKNGMRLRYGRIITKREPTIQVVFDTDTTATAYVSRHLEGRFVSMTGKMENDTLTLKKFDKPLVHDISRIVKLVKFRNDTTNERRNWKVSSVSMAEGASSPNDIAIVSLTIYPENQDSIVVTDPAAYFINGVSMLTLPRQTDVTVRVKVKNNTSNPIFFPRDTQATESVRLQYGRNRRGDHAKKPFTFEGKDNAGNNVYVGNWTVKQFAGYQHAVIDVIDNGTILSSDDVNYPYESSTWGMPYRVSPF